jgi:hypothetical protein
MDALHENLHDFLCAEMTIENSQRNLQPDSTHATTWGIPRDDVIT